MVKTCPFIRKIWWYTFAVYLPFAVFLPTANPKYLPFADSKSKRQQNDMSSHNIAMFMNDFGGRGRHHATADLI